MRDPITTGLWSLLVDLQRSAGLEEWWRRAIIARPVGRSEKGPDQPDVRESRSPEQSLAGTTRTTDLGAVPAPTTSEEAR